MTLAPPPTITIPTIARRDLLPPFGGPSGGRGIIPDPPHGPPLVRLTVDLYDDWIERGILPTDPTIELIDGVLVRKDRSHVGEDPMSYGTGHSHSVQEVASLRERVEAAGGMLHSQQPLCIYPFDEPEPDAVILLAADEAFRRKATSAEATCAIEVSDSSLRTDRLVKIAVYAAGMIPQYVIINLVDRVIEDHRNPGPAGYARRTVLRPGETIGLLLPDGSTLDVPVDELLP